MLARRGRAAHVCEANRNCTINENKNLRENRKESQLPSKSEGCNERYGFRGNCDSQGKLGMCPSLAESLAVGFSRNHVSRETMYKNKLFFRQLAANTKPQANKKFFDPTIFQKCWRGVGEQPTFAKQIETAQ